MRYRMPTSNATVAGKKANMHRNAPRSKNILRRKERAKAAKVARAKVAKEGARTRTRGSQKEVTIGTLHKVARAKERGVATIV